MTYDIESVPSICYCIYETRAFSNGSFVLYVRSKRDSSRWKVITQMDGYIETVSYRKIVDTLENGACILFYKVK